MRHTALIICFLCLGEWAAAQHCGTPMAIAARNRATPGYADAVDRLYDNARAQRGVLSDTIVYRIPVVVHVVYHTADENLDLTLIHSQINALNRDFRRRNDDTVDTRSVFLPVAADSHIEFYLAGTDPDGNPTGGITRTFTDQLNFPIDITGQGLDNVKQSALGGKDAWDTERYLNIWVCNTIDPQSPFGEIIGYAYPPSGAPNWPDGSGAPQPQYEGVVVHYQVFGDGNPLAQPDFSFASRGRTCVHEVGHFLGLRHTWGDAIIDGCSADDGLSDTPNCSTDAFYGCDKLANTCNDGVGDLPDMIENYLDYADEACMNLFTKQQTDVMRSMLEGVRNPLITGGIPVTGIDDKSIERTVVVFPNPASDILFIDSEERWKLFQLVDLEGRVVKSVALTELDRPISLADVSNGIYVIWLTDGADTAHVRLCVQH